MVKESVLQDVKQAIVWSVMANETVDRNKQEVMMLVLRYVLQHGSVWEVHEPLILLFDIYREIDAYLADTAQLSNHDVMRMNYRRR